jgi:hypothetical protein
MKVKIISAAMALEKHPHSSGLTLHLNGICLKGYIVERGQMSSHFAKIT